MSRRHFDASCWPQMSFFESGFHYSEQVFDALFTKFLVTSIFKTTATHQESRGRQSSTKSKLNLRQAKVGEHLSAAVIMKKSRGRKSKEEEEAFATVRLREPRFEFIWFPKLLFLFFLIFRPWEILDSRPRPPGQSLSSGPWRLRYPGRRNSEMISRNSRISSSKGWKMNYRKK